MKIVQGIILLTIGVLVGLLSTQLMSAMQYPAGTAAAHPFPVNHIPEQNIEVYSDRVILHIDNPRWASFAATHSMNPVFDAGNHAIQVIPQSPDDIQVGDIISYSYGDRTIIHRVTEKAVDGQGWYFITKGDNNPTEDPDKVRFSQVTRITVAVIY